MYEKAPSEAANKNIPTQTIKEFTMKGFYLGVAGFLFAYCSAPLFAAVTTKNPSVDPKVTQSIADYKVCDVQGLVNQLSQKYEAVYMKDDLANYNYYLIKNNQELNADVIRKATCQFIMANNCYVYWGNVANMAMLAANKAAWFPADTSPHYLLSPIVTCDQLPNSKK